MITIKDFAKSQGVTYEAIRKQLKRYEKELTGHIHKVGRRQFLDEFAMDFLSEKRDDSPIIQRQQDKDEQIATLKLQIEQMLVENAKLNQKVADMAEAAAKTKLLEESVRSKDEQIASQTAKIAEFEALTAQKDESLAELEKTLNLTGSELSEAKSALEYYENQSFIDRFLNRKYKKQG